MNETISQEVLNGSKESLPVVMEDPTITVYMKDWGSMSSYIEVHPQAFDTHEYFAKLPNGQCHCPHWGYVYKGRMRVFYSDREEVVEAGSIYYLSPGHNISVEAGTELVEFSPADQLQETINAVTGS